MSGHSRWAGIKHKKAIIDAKKGKVFTRIAREITVAAKGGGNPDMNPRLRKAIEDAKAANMPSENVKRAIQKGTGEIPGVTIEEVTYEGYGPGGVAVFVEGTTDNRNRTSSEMRKIFDSHGGAMGGSGAVAWMFELKGYITVNKAGANEDQITELAIEAGAEDIKSDDDVIEIYTAPADFEAVRTKLTAAKVALTSAEITMIPKNTVAVDGEKAQQCLKLMDELDNHDDVKNAYANFDIPKEVLDKIA